MATNENKHGFERWKEQKEPIFSATDGELIVNEIPYIVQDILAEDSFSAICGLPESYKSFLTSHLAYCVATGQPFLNRFEIKKKGKVLYCAFEGSTNVIKFRLKKLIDRNCEDYHTLPCQGLSFSDVGFVSQLKKTIEEEQVILLIIDTYRASFLGDENSSNDTTVILSKIRDAAKNCAVWFVAHSGKTADRQLDYSNIYSLMRGSTALSGALDYVYGLQFIESESSPPEEVSLILTQAKNRNASKLTDIRVVMSEIDNKITFNSSFVVNKLSKKMQQIREEILQTLREADKPLSTAEIAPHNATSRNSKLAQLQEMVKESIILQDDDGKYIAI